MEKISYSLTSLHCEDWEIKYYCIEVLIANSINKQIVL